MPHPLVLSVPYSGTHFALQLLRHFGADPRYEHAMERSRLKLQQVLPGTPVFVPTRNPFLGLLSAWNNAGASRPPIETVVGNRLEYHRLLREYMGWFPNLLRFEVDQPPREGTKAFAQRVAYALGLYETPAVLDYVDAWAPLGWRNPTYEYPAWPVPQHERFAAECAALGYDVPGSWDELYVPPKRGGALGPETHGLTNGRRLPGNGSNNGNTL